MQDLKHSPSHKLSTICAHNPYLVDHRMLEIAQHAEAATHLTQEILFHLEPSSPSDDDPLPAPGAQAPAESCLDQSKTVLLHLKSIHTRLLEISRLSNEQVSSKLESENVALKTPTKPNLISSPKSIKSARDHRLPALTSPLSKPRRRSRAVLQSDALESYESDNDEAENRDLILVTVKRRRPATVSVLLDGDLLEDTESDDLDYSDQDDSEEDYESSCDDMDLDEALEPNSPNTKLRTPISDQSTAKSPKQSGYSVE